MSKMQFKKVIQTADWEETLCAVQTQIHHHKLPLTFSRDEWKKIIPLFLMEQSSNSINEQTGFEKRRVLRALTKIRFVMMQYVPEIFSGTVEVDETYLGGQWKNKRKTIRDKEPRNNRYSEFFVATVRFGLRLSMTLELIPFNHSSHKKYQQVLSFVPIPGKLTPE